MNCFSILLITVLFLSGFSTKAQLPAYDSIIRERLSGIHKGLDTIFFVKRFESIETPCVCIDSTNDKIAYVHRKVINSNYRILLNKNGKVDETGVQCLSKYYNRYARFRVSNYDPKSQTLSGECSFTYGYPSPGIIQYLGFTHNAPNRENAFYAKLMQSTGWFTLYPENDKFKMKLSLNTGPYNEKDTFYAYLEIVQSVYSPARKIVYQLFFDQMNLFKGDKNNQVSLRFSSTSFSEEAVYHTNLLYNKLKYINSATKDQYYAEAAWVKNFFNDPKCPQCKYIYNQAAFMVNHKVFSLPNTEPSPPH